MIALRHGYTSTADVPNGLAAVHHVHLISVILKLEHAAPDKYMCNLLRVEAAAPLFLDLGVKSVTAVVWW